jgi:hypothetical protein
VKHYLMPLFESLLRTRHELRIAVLPPVVVRMPQIRAQRTHARAAWSFQPYTSAACITITNVALPNRRAAPPPSRTPPYRPVRIYRAREEQGSHLSLADGPGRVPETLIARRPSSSSSRRSF